jgi:hypothetical protein
LLSKTWGFLRTRKKFWLPPIAVMLLVVASLLIIAKVAIVLPFIYALF